MDRKQPIVIGQDTKGELIWGFVPMSYWQMAMFPLKYIGDFAAHWMRARMFAEYGMECDQVSSATFQSFVPGPLEKKYKEKRRHHKGD